LIHAENVTEDKKNQLQLISVREKLGCCACSRVSIGGGDMGAMAPSHNLGF